ncbi:unnamed protein product, partial [Gulo gulo]
WNWNPDLGETGSSSSLLTLARSFWQTLVFQEVAGGTEAPTRPLRRWPPDLKKKGESCFFLTVV